jgi:chlorite dismutase
MTTEADALYRKGVELFKRKNLVEAADAFLAAVEADPDHAESTRSTFQKTLKELLAQSGSFASVHDQPRRVRDRGESQGAIR